MLLIIRHLVDWILEHKIVELSFGKGIHTEIVRRAIDMVKYLAFYSHLEKSHLDLIWESMQGKHESIKHAIQQAISDLSNVLSYEDLDYLFEKIFKVEYSEYDNQMLIMVRQCTIDVVRHVMMHNNVSREYYIYVFMLYRVNIRDGMDLKYCGIYYKIKQYVILKYLLDL